MAFVITAGVCWHSHACRRRTAKARKFSTACEQRGGSCPSRRAFLVTAGAALTYSLTETARAVETRTVSLQSLRAARGALVELREAVNLKEWESFRAGLRAGSLGRIRASGNNLANSAAPGAEMEMTRAAYRKLISSVESLDSHVLRASRGGASRSILEDLDQTVGSLDAFIQTVESHYTE